VDDEDGDLLPSVDEAGSYRIPRKFPSSLGR
jgi:hypothetical protein